MESSFESSFLFLIVGVFLFISKILFAKKNTGVQLITFLCVGLLTGTIVGLMESQTFIPGLPLPWVSGSIIGVLAAVLLFLAEKIDFFNRPGVRFLATSLLAIILALMCYVMLVFYMTYFCPDKDFPFAKEMVFIIFLLYTFIIIFGYTFPKRWFIKHENKP
jgi:hypothetical protein